MDAKIHIYFFLPNYYYTIKQKKSKPPFLAACYFIANIYSTSLTKRIERFALRPAYPGKPEYVSFVLIS